MLRYLARAFSSILFFTLLIPVATPAAQEPAPVEIPFFELVPAPPLVLPGSVDSNSPSFWQFVQGQNRLHVVTSWWTPSISRGVSLGRLGASRPITFENSDAGGKWFESIIQDESGVLYGYYHNEPIGLCPATTKTAPRIGAARSTDNGATWLDLGIILQVGNALDCSTPNEFFAGGIGDFSVILNQEKTDAYFFFTIYSGGKSRQGIGTARMPWAQRNTPQGNVAVWDGQTWRYPFSSTLWIRRGLSSPRPIYPAAISWHDVSGAVDSFWGPSIHWNTFLNQYVMLMNRASDSAWSQEGIYIAFSPVLDEPQRWTQPVKIVSGGPFYPQIMGSERGQGTDKVAGARARLFLRGRSDYFIVFRK